MKRYRSSVTGRYVSKQYADNHQRTTVAETQRSKTEDGQPEDRGRSGGQAASQNGPSDPDDRVPA
jgi:hypothetical protein